MLAWHLCSGETGLRTAAGIRDGLRATRTGYRKPPTPQPSLAPPARRLTRWPGCSGEPPSIVDQDRFSERASCARRILPGEHGVIDTGGISEHPDGDHGERYQGLIEGECL